MLLDAFGRQIKDLRISVTDRCNFRCFYCKAAKGVHYEDRHELLTYEEICRMTRLFLQLGIRKVRVTGGEPLLRRNLPTLIGKLAALPGLEDLALTTNGFNFAKEAVILRRAGLGRVTISLDSLRKERFQEITQSGEFENVLESIQVARELGLQPVKINCVVVRDINDIELVDFAAFAREQEIKVRFIEFMPLDEDEQWTQDRVVTGEEILRVLRRQFKLIEQPMRNPHQTSRNYGFSEGSGEIGLIMPVSRPFCGSCSRIRLTADGKLRTCLFSLVEHDAKSLLRGGASDEDLVDFIRKTTLKKEPGHRINEPDFRPPSRTMSYIGG